ncbi:hypothetical protein [Kitasatospora aureofaciens]|uniref:hypothetical protein n=1 Tax=Kitasatospora aureofaciens TaxID=1894 RepID=UPI000524F994|nr:hypothetical protein [Kitasatospora aureofaciens]
MRRAPVSVVGDPDTERGYRGTLYRPSAGGPIPFRNASVAYDDFRVAWLMAAAQEAVLRECTIVDLLSELAAAGHAELASRVAAAYPAEASAVPMSAGPSG